MIKDDMAWWVDLGATRHICKNKDFLKNMKPVENDTVIFIENSASVPIMGIGDVEQNFTFGRVLTCTIVYYVPKVRKNVVSSSLRMLYRVVS